MSYRKLYSLYPRSSGGRTIYYYRTYDEAGARSSGRSTGQSSQAAAHAWMRERIERGELIPVPRMSFGSYATDWWVWDRCRYIQRKNAGGKTKISHAYADTERSYLTRHILPTFGPLPLERITVAVADRWMLALRASGLSPATVNNCLRCLKKMLTEAVRTGLLRANPLAAVEQLEEEGQGKGVPTSDEVRVLFGPGSLERVWRGDLLTYTANLLAATTGMRLGEIQALQRSQIGKHSLQVTHAWSRKYGRKSTKSGEERTVPLPPRVATCLAELPGGTPDWYVFSLSGERPVNERTITGALYRALAAIGITEAKRRERALSFHSWRYYLNTQLQLAGVPLTLLWHTVGHASEEMTRRYTALSPEDLAELARAQARILPFAAQA